MGGGVAQNFNSQLYKKILLQSNSDKRNMDKNHLDIRNIFTLHFYARQTFYVNKTTDKRNSSYRPLSFFYPSLTVHPTNPQKLHSGSFDMNTK